MLNFLNLSMKKANVSNLRKDRTKAWFLDFYFCLIVIQYKK